MELLGVAAADDRLEMEGLNF